MLRKLGLLLFAALLCAPLLAVAGDEEDAMKALDEANAHVVALSAIRSPNLQNFQSAQGELSTLPPFFDKVAAALGKLNVGPSAQLLEIGASVEAKVSDAGKVSTVNLSVFIDSCRGLLGDLDRWQAMLPDVRRALQQRVDQKTQDLIRGQVAQAFPTPIPGLGSGPSMGLPTPTPVFSFNTPAPAPTSAPLVPAASTPTPVPPASGGVIPGGWVPGPVIPTPIPGQPTAEATPQAQAKSPLAIAVGHNNQRVCVANYGSNTVSLIEARSDQVVKTVNVGAGPMQVLITHGGKAYVLCQDGRSLAVIDLKLRLLLHSIPLSSRPGRMDVPNSHGQIYVTLPDEDSVAVVDTGFDTVMAVVKDR